MVKVSHGTQTVPLVIPVVRQQPLNQSGTAGNVHTSTQDTREPLEQERTPEPRARLCLPPSYTRIITPLQAKTSLVYLLCSPESPPTTQPSPCLRSIAGGNRRGRKRKRSLESEESGGLKVKYKRVPLRLYDPVTNQILKSAPRGALKSNFPSSSPKPTQPHVRQLFRSLSPELNAERLAGEGRGPGGRRGRGGERGREGDSRSRGRGGGRGGSAASGSLKEGSVGVKVQGSSEAGSSTVTRPFSRSSLSNSSRFPLGTLSTDSTSNPEAVGQQGRTEGRAGERRGQKERNGGGGRKRRGRRTTQPEPQTPEKGPSPPYRPRKPGGRRGRRGGRRDKTITRGSERGADLPPPPVPKDLSPTPQRRTGASRRAAESRKVPGSKGPARSSPSSHRTMGWRTSPRHSLRKR